MHINELKQRRAQWQRMAEEDQVTFGAFHTVTQVDVEMRDMYDALIAKMEADASQPTAARDEERSEEYDRRHPWGREGSL